MTELITRRDFLKLAGVLPLSVTAPRFLNSLGIQQNKQNVLVIVFDALSARNISLYGYSRETTPNLARLADRAVVYHNHYSAASYTTPGTASLLTGTYPWTHRAFGLEGKNVIEAIARKNYFEAFQGFHRLAYSHNPLAISLLEQFSEAIDELIPRKDYMLSTDKIVDTFFYNDDDIATVSWIRGMKKQEEGFAYSLFLSRFYEKYQKERFREIRKFFPYSPPSINADNYYVLEHAIDGVGDKLKVAPRPFCGYFHFYPPHAPYRTRIEYFDAFENDVFTPLYKPDDLFTEGLSIEVLMRRRKSYDEFILYLDNEFGRLYDFLENSNLLENTWIVFTSDHGEMFERGIHGHQSEVLYQPAIHIPLIIFEPGRTSRRDVYTPTSAVDVLPTILHVTGQQKAGWTEGVILPPFDKENENLERSIYALRGNDNKPLDPLIKATVMLIKGQYKLTYFFGYEILGGSERIELYDLKNDPEELNDLSRSKRETTAEMLSEIKQKLAEVNEPYL